MVALGVINLLCAAMNAVSYKSNGDWTYLLIAILCLFAAASCFVNRKYEV